MISESEMELLSNEPQDKRNGSYNTINSCFELKDLPEEFVDFSRKYFAGAHIDDVQVDRTIFLCKNIARQQSLVDLVLNSPILQRFNAKRRIHLRILKKFISELESKNSEISDGLYSALIASLNSNQEYGHRVFLCEDRNNFIVLKEKNIEISSGTTGLTCWQGSCDMANYLLKKGFSFQDSKNVLELGAGCGLTAIAIAASGSAKSITITDGNEKVLQLLKENVEANFSSLLQKKLKIEIQLLDWCKEGIDLLKIQPDLVIAADVIYDTSVVPALLDTLSKLLSKSPTGRLEFLTANVLRNAVTMQNFLNSADSMGLMLKKTLIYDDEVWITEGEKEEFVPSLFPFNSNIKCPTVFHYFHMTTLSNTN